MSKWAGLKLDQVGKLSTHLDFRIKITPNFESSKILDILLYSRFGVALMRQLINDRACRKIKLHVFFKKNKNMYYVLFFIPEVQNVISPMET